MSPTVRSRAWVGNWTGPRGGTADPRASRRCILRCCWTTKWSRSRLSCSRSSTRDDDMGLVPPRVRLLRSGIEIREKTVWEFVFFWGHELPPGDLDSPVDAFVDSEFLRGVELEPRLHLIIWRLVETASE